MLHVEPDQQHQLPPPDETWGWAHVQSSRPFEEVADAVEDEPSALRSRIVCPRLMKPGVRYRAALVNAFAAGRRGAVGARVDDVRPRRPSISSSTTPGRSRRRPRPATSSRSASSSCRPTEVGELGVRAVDVTEPGLDVDVAALADAVDLVGALADPGVITDDPPAGNARVHGSRRADPRRRPRPRRLTRPTRTATTRCATIRSSGCRSTEAGRRRRPACPTTGWAGG